MLKSLRISSSGQKSRGTIFILGCTFLLMLLFNCLTPLISDDYSYILRFPTHEPIQSLSDLISSQYYHYMQWGGRTIAIGLNQIFLWVGKWIFNIANAAAFTTTVWATAKLAVGKSRVHPAFLLVVIGLLVHFNPAFGAVNLWMCGSCVYLWPVMFGVLFLLPYRFYLESPFAWSKKAVVGIFFLGLVAGWGNENTSGAVLLAGILFCIFFYTFFKKVPLGAIVGVVGCLCGFLLLMCAPGQWERMDSVDHDPHSMLVILLSRFINATYTIKLYGIVLAVIFVVLYCCLCICRPQKRDLLLPGFWFFLGIAANYSLVLSPVYYIRSFYAVLLFWVIGIGSALHALVQYTPNFSKLIPQAACGALCVFLCFDLLEGGYDIVNYYTMRQVREQSILQQAASGETDIETYAIYPYTRFCGAYGQPDLRLDKNNWVNVNMALHLNVNSLTATEQHYYPFPGYDDFSNTVDTQLSYGLE